MPERWGRHAACAGGVLVCAVCALLPPAARHVGVCMLGRATEPSSQSTVRLLGGLAGLAAIEPLLVVDGRADSFALHAPVGAQVGLLEMLAADAVGAHIHALRARDAAGAPRAAERPPDWLLRVARQRTCRWALDSPAPALFSRLDGLTLIAHDTAIAVAHYFHVVEHLLSLWALRATFFPGVRATRLVLVGKTRDLDVSPASPKGRFMRTLVRALFPNATIVPPSEWATTARRSSLLLEQAAVSSRMTCQRHAASAALNKMLAAHAASIRAHAPSFRDALLAGLGVELPPKRALTRPGARGAGEAPGSPARRAVQGRPLIVGLVDRGASSRRLAPDFKARLLAALRADARFEAAALRFQDLHGVRAQAEAAARLDVMIGCHGNGLTHALLMRPPAVLVELFPANINHADYQLHAEVAGHRHFGWSDRDGLLTRSPYVAECAQAYGVYAHYRHKSDRSVFRGAGGNATIDAILDLTARVALARDDEWRALVAPAGACARDGRM